MLCQNYCHSTLREVSTKKHIKINNYKEKGGVVVSTLDFGLNGPGSSPGRGHCVVFLARNFTLIVPLSTQVYK